MMKIEEKIKKSPINYFSDLFIISMVMAWIAVIVIMLIFAIYSTVIIADTSIWSYLTELVSMPLSAGGAVWMIKNGVQHAIANRNGKQAHMDFPKVDVEDIEYEKAETEDFTDDTSEESED